MQSVGTVNMRWAFAEEPTKPIQKTCHVLPVCTYDLILGSKFLAATETLVKYRRRVTECAFTMLNVFHLNLLDNCHQGLEVQGGLGDHPASAIADTGAERNVIDLYYAKALDLDINARPEDRGFLQFADGTFQETVGQVNTTWTFADGLKIPVTFEVLENSSADVILGEEVLWEYNVFQTYATTRQGVPYENDGVQVSDLAPFSYQKHWQRKARHLKYQILSVFNKHTHGDDPLEDETLAQYQTSERHRRDQWHHQYGFEGAKASLAEKEAEARRKASYEARIEAFRRRPPGRAGRSAPLIPSIPTAPIDAAAIDPTAANQELVGNPAFCPPARQPLSPPQCSSIPSPRNTEPFGTPPVLVRSRNEIPGRARAPMRPSPQRDVALINWCPRSIRYNV